ELLLQLLALGVALLGRPRAPLVHELAQAVERAPRQGREVGEEALRRAVERVAEAARQQQQLGAERPQLRVGPRLLERLDAGGRALAELTRPGEVVVAALALVPRQEVVAVRQLEDGRRRGDEPAPAHERGRVRQDRVLVHWRVPMIAAS